MGYKWFFWIVEKLLLINVEGYMVCFKDGILVEVDDIILCIGYYYFYLFLEEWLWLSGLNGVYFEGLYKVILWICGGNNKVFYIGVFYYFYIFIMFDV